MPNYVALGKYPRDDIWQFIDEIDSPSFKDAQLEMEGTYPELDELRLIVVAKETTYTKVWTRGDIYEGID